LYKIEEDSIKQRSESDRTDAFANCSSTIDSITFPSIIKIGDRAFQGSSLKEIIHMSNRLPLRWSWDVFQGCPIERVKVRLNKISEIIHMKERIREQGR